MNEMLACVDKDHVSCGACTFTDGQMHSVTSWSSTWQHVCIQCMSTNAYARQIFPYVSSVLYHINSIVRET